MYEACALLLSTRRGCRHGREVKQSLTTRQQQIIPAAQGRKVRRALARTPTPSWFQPSERTTTQLFLVTEAAPLLATVRIRG